MTPETRSSEIVFNGKVFDVRTDDIREGEIEYSRDIVVHKGSAVILPLYSDRTIGFVRQYRHAARKYMLELPAGTFEDGEEPMVCAKRELEEELGVTASSIEKLSEFYVSPGFLTEKMHVFLATELTETQQKLEDDEILAIERIKISDSFELLRSGEIEDAKTLIGLMFLGQRLSP